MGVDFSWRAGGTEAVLPDLAPEPRRRPKWRRRLLAIVLAVAAVGGLVAWRAWRGEEAARADLQRVVEREVIALAAGQREEFLSLLARRTPFYWYSYHDASFYEESAWFAARPTAQVRVERVRLSADRAAATVALDDGKQTWRGTWYYQRIDGEWRHAAPPQVASPEPQQSATVGRVTVTAQGLGEEETVRLAAELSALCEGLIRRYGLVPEAYMAPEEWAGEPLPPLRIEVEVSPTRNRLVCNWAVRPYATRLTIEVPAPELALELRAPEEQSAALHRSVRLELASELLFRSGRNLPLAQALAFWHARAWEPEWEACVRTALAEGTWRRYLDLWEPGTADDEEWWRAVFGRYEGASEELMLKAVSDWVGTMGYSLGEYLGTSYPPERLGALLQASELTWPGLRAELGVTREELEEDWGAFLRGKCGGGETADGGG